MGLSGSRNCEMEVSKPDDVGPAKGRIEHRNQGSVEHLLRE